MTGDRRQQIFRSGRLLALSVANDLWTELSIAPATTACSAFLPPEYQSKIQAV